MQNYEHSEPDYMHIAQPWAQIMENGASPPPNLSSNEETMQQHFPD